MDEIYDKKYFFIIGLIVFGIFLFGALINVGANDITAFSLASNQTNQTCFDSDGGINYNLKGYVQIDTFNSSGNSSNTYWDRCTLPNQQIIEYYCLNNGLSYSINYCNCIDGACVTATTTTTSSTTSTTVLQTTTTTSSSTSTTTLPINQTCFDSDGGRNYYLRGTVTMLNGSIVTDWCSYPWYAPTGILSEYYCNNEDNIAADYYTCSGGCTNGACAVPTTSTTTSSSTTSTTALGYGNVYVVSNPNRANIYLDGVYKGKTNKTLFNISNMQHNLKLTKKGYLDYVTTVTVHNGQTNYVYALLQKVNTTNSYNIKSKK